MSCPEPQGIVVVKFLLVQDWYVCHDCQQIITLGCGKGQLRQQVDEWKTGHAVVMEHSAGPKDLSRFFGTPAAHCVATLGTDWPSQHARHPRTHTHAHARMSGC